MSAYKTCYEKLSARGLSYHAIKKRMVQIARNDQVDGKYHYTHDDQGYVDEVIKNCGNCDTLLSTDDYFCEITDYACTVWYRCPKCGKYNHFIF